VEATGRKRGTGLESAELGIAHADRGTARQPGILERHREPPHHKVMNLRLRHDVHDEPVNHLDVTEGIRRPGQG
jgi:hypothetical protein